MKSEIPQRARLQALSKELDNRIKVEKAARIEADMTERRARSPGGHTPKIGRNPEKSRRKKAPGGGGSRLLRVTDFSGLR